MEISRELIEKIESYEWCWYIDSDIRGYDYFEKKLEEIARLAGTDKLKGFIGVDIFRGKGVEIIRVAGFAEFDDEGTGFEMFYKDSHTKAKWYVKFQNQI